jgi:polyhydroxybutyrate depolymerase
MPRLGAAASLVMLLALLLGPARAQDETGTLVFAGMTRSYLLHVPPGDGGGKRPLVIALHGAGADGAAFAAETKLGAAADAARMLAVFPDGIQSAPGRGTWNAHFCCGIAATQGIDDIGFIGALIAAVDARHPVDRARVYATGMSNGGMFAYQLAAAHPEWFAAIAPVSSTIGGIARNGTSFLIGVPARPVPVMIIHGKKDAYVLYDGGSAPSLKFPNHWKMSVADAVSFWVAADGCPAEPELSEADQGRLQRIAYRGCKDGSEVVLWSIADGYHEWPADARFPAAGGTRSAAAEIVAFFAAHVRE